MIFFLLGLSLAIFGGVLIMSTSKWLIIKKIFGEKDRSKKLKLIINEISYPDMSSVGYLLLSIGMIGLGLFLMLYVGR